MPVYLRPISRRQFLGRAAVLTSLCVAPALMAAGRKVDADSWALFADTHIAADRSRVARDVNLAAQFQQATAEVLDLPRRPVGMFLVGDCALSTGESGDYETLRELLLQFRGARIPTHLLLGNHDNRERFWTAFPKTRKGSLKEKHTATVKSGHVNWFLLDSLETTNSTPGLLGAEQLDWLDRELDKNKSRPAIVVAHHNLGTEVSINGLKDSQDFLHVIRPRSQVKAFIFGHTHRWQVSQDPSGVHLINLPPVAYVFRPDDPSGWVQASLQRKGMDLQLHCIDKSHKLNGQRVELQWR